jgi:hypothetical protein
LVRPNIPATNPDAQAASYIISLPVEIWGHTVASDERTRALCMTEGGCSGDEEGSNCEEVAVGAGAGVAGFMMCSGVEMRNKVLVEGCSRLDAVSGRRNQMSWLKRRDLGRNHSTFVSYA